ncbi:hypothetical protein C8R44DRAFT_745367 [Mycena epipterygia]|nr:hypothetical protein C8R44DRAFT_745367 [Mycena epipterygia]
MHLIVHRPPMRARRVQRSAGAPDARSGSVIAHCLSEQHNASAKQGYPRASTPFFQLPFPVPTRPPAPGACASAPIGGATAGITSARGWDTELGVEWDTEFAVGWGTELGVGRGCRVRSSASTDGGRSGVERARDEGTGKDNVSIWECSREGNINRKKSAQLEGAGKCKDGRVCGKEYRMQAAHMIRRGGGKRT